MKNEKMLRRLLGKILTEDEEEVLPIVLSGSLTKFCRHCHSVIGMHEKMVPLSGNIALHQGCVQPFLKIRKEEREGKVEKKKIEMTIYFVDDKSSVRYKVLVDRISSAKIIHPEIEYHMKCLSMEEMEDIVEKGLDCDFLFLDAKTVEGYEKVVTSLSSVKKVPGLVVFYGHVPPGQREGYENMKLRLELAKVHVKVCPLYDVMFSKLREKHDLSIIEFP